MVLLIQRTRKVVYNTNDSIASLALVFKELY